MSALRTDRPRNAGLAKERARVDYAQRRLNELRLEGIEDAAAWETIRAEIKSGKLLLTRTELVDLIDPIMGGLPRAWGPEGSVIAVQIAAATLAAIAKAAPKSIEPTKALKEPAA